jgi:hypothetical protein
LKYCNINDVEIMISPIDNLIKMFFQWKVNMLANTTLASIAQCMKFKLLYDDWVRIYSLKRSNQPVITTFHIYESNNNFKKKRVKIIKEKNNNNDNNNNVANEYEIDLDDYDSEENNSKASIDFTIVENMEKLNIQPEI